MAPWFIAGALIFAALTGYAGFGIGKKVERGVWMERDLGEAQKVIVRQEVLVREVPKIVTRTVTKEMVVEKEVERVVTVIQKVLAPDCVLPDGYGMLLVAAARGLDPAAPGSVDEARGTYGCVETLAATLKDLEAGWKNSERLTGLQGWAKLVTTKDPK